MKLKVRTILKGMVTSGILMAMLFGLVGIGSVKADINPLLNFAGKVTNTDGSELADGVYDFIFSLYTSPTSTSAIWTEDLTSAGGYTFSAAFSSAVYNAGSETSEVSYTGRTNAGTLRVGQYLTHGSDSLLITSYDNGASTITVAGDASAWSGGTINNRPYVTGGVIDINLGAVTDLSSINFNQPLYLEVIFNGETMRPRKVLYSVPYAFEAASVGGKTATDIPGLDENETVTGIWHFDNTLSASSTSASAALTITQNGSGNIVEFKRATTTVDTTAFAIDSNGRVQIGDYYFPLSRGTNQQALMTDGSGNLYWGTPTGAGTINAGTAGQIAYFDASGNVLSGSSLVFLATTTNRVGIGAISPSVLLQVGSSTPSHVSGYRDTFLSGSLEIGDLLYINGNGTSIIGGNLDVAGTLEVGSTFSINGSGVVTSGIWQGSTLGMSYGGTGNTSFAQGSIVFSNGTILTQDNNNLYWDNINKMLGVGTSTLAANSALTVGGDMWLSGNVLPLS